MESIHALCSLIMRSLSGLPFGEMRIIQIAPSFMCSLIRSINLQIVGSSNHQMFIYEFIGQLADESARFNASTIHNDELMGQFLSNLNMLLRQHHC